MILDRMPSWGRSISSNSSIASDDGRLTESGRRKFSEADPLHATPAMVEVPVTAVRPPKSLNRPPVSNIHRPATAGFPVNTSSFGRRLSPKCVREWIS